MSIDIITKYSRNECFQKLKKTRNGGVRDGVVKVEESTEGSENGKKAKKACGKKRFQSTTCSLIRGTLRNILLPLSRLLQTNCIINTRAMCSIFTCSALIFLFSFHFFLHLILVHPAATAAVKAKTTTTAITTKKRWKSNIM